MDNVKRYSAFIKRIISAPEPVRVQLLRSSNLNIIKAICEIILNIVQKNITVDKAVIAGLRKHRTVVYRLLESKGFESRKAIFIDYPKIILPLAGVL